MREERVLGRSNIEEESSPELPAAPFAEVRVQSVEERRPRARPRLPKAEKTNFRLLEQVVAEEHLVGPLSGQDRLDPGLAGELREQVERRGCCPNERRLHVADHVWKDA